MSGKRKKPLFKRFFSRRVKSRGSHKALSVMFAALGAVLLVLGISGAPALATGGGNNGTLKIHEQGTPSGTEDNDPKVCVFNVEGFGFDAEQSGYLYFDVQGGDGPTGTPAGPFDFGPTNANGYYATQYFNLDPGHYKATLYGKPGREDEKAKSKVFKVECEVPVTQVPVPTQATLDPCNPQGVENNVAWKDPLPADTNQVDWSESNGGATRTATLIGDNVEWNDGTTTPKVFNLPADSGEECEAPEPEGNLVVSSTCESITIGMPTGVKPEGAQIVIKLDGVSVVPDTYPVTPGSHTVDLYVNGEKVDSETIVVEECEAPPTVVTVPTQETVDPCNPQGVTNNVAWKSPLSADTDTIDWSESNNGATRTATLIGNTVWSDETTAPKVFNLPADSGVTCVPPEECPDGYQDENPQAPCYVEKPPVNRVEIGTAEGCKLHGVGGVETTNTVYTTTFSFNEQTQQWVSSEAVTSSSVSFTPYTKAELKAKGCVKASPPPGNNPPPNHPTSAPHAGATPGQFGVSNYLLIGSGAAFLLAAFVLFGVPRRRVGEV